MAVRVWTVWPDEESGVVSRQDIRDALLDLESVLYVCGGVFTVMAARAPTNVPGEMATTGVVIEWKDRTDARPQPERASSLPAEPVVDEAAVVAAADAAVLVEDEAVGAVLDPDAAAMADMPDEDVSSIPAGMR